MLEIWSNIDLSSVIMLRNEISWYKRELKQNLKTVIYETNIFNYVIKIIKQTVREQQPLQDS